MQALCVDNDGDGYGVGPLCTVKDCNDDDQDINPSITEIPCDGIDNDCADGDKEFSRSKSFSLETLLNYTCNIVTFVLEGIIINYDCAIPYVPDVSINGIPWYIANQGYDDNSDSLLIEAHALNSPRNPYVCVLFIDGTKDQSPTINWTFYSDDCPDGEGSTALSRIF